MNFSDFMEALDEETKVLKGGFDESEEDGAYPVLGNVCSCSSCSWYGFNDLLSYSCPVCGMPVAVVEKNQFHPKYAVGLPLSIEFSVSNYKNMKRNEIKFPVFAEEQRRYLDLWRIRLNGIFESLTFINKSESFSLIFYTEEDQSTIDVVYKIARIKLFKSIVMPSDMLGQMADDAIYSLIVQSERKEADNVKNNKKGKK